MLSTLVDKLIYKGYFRSMTQESPVIKSPKKETIKFCSAGAWETRNPCGLWRYLNIDFGLWRNLNIDYGLWGYLNIDYGFWRYLNIDYGLWRYIIIDYGLWRNLNIDYGL